VRFVTKRFARPHYVAALTGGFPLGSGAFAEPRLRALDAIHLAAAIDSTPLDGFVTYDERQAAAARLAGLRTVAPGT